MRPVGWTQLLCSSETAVTGHRTCGNQWALWRRSGGDRRIRRTETWEGVLCERWDSRRGSIRYLLFYRAQTKESMRGRQEPAPTTSRLRKNSVFMPEFHWSVHPRQQNILSRMLKKSVQQGRSER